MTKKILDRLLKQTKRHWEKDILNASEEKLKDKCPIESEFCAVCKYFNDSANCEECFLHSKYQYSYFDCLTQVNKARSLLQDYQTNDTISIERVRKVCQEAYQAILKRFDREYKKMEAQNDK